MTNNLNKTTGHLTGMTKGALENSARTQRGRRLVSRFLALTAAVLTLLIMTVMPVCGASLADYEDGEYSVAVEITGGSGKAYVSSPALMTLKDGEAFVKLTWSSANYDYMIVNGEKYYNESEENMNSSFTVPIPGWNRWINVQADTTAMGEPVEITYRLYFYSDSIGSVGELPQVAAKKVLITAAVIIIGGGILNAVLKNKFRV
ncbi:MAG: hypothetical protein Q4B73_03660 [Lachnospiraceae bacterium]|nr:hypothetical protein [Lachnospiraceae bacterium]